VSGYHEADHVAPVAGRMTVFASVEYPADEPPETIEIRGEAFVRVRDRYCHDCEAALHAAD